MAPFSPQVTVPDDVGAVDVIRVADVTATVGTGRAEGEPSRPRDRGAADVPPAFSSRAIWSRGRSDLHFGDRTVLRSGLDSPRPF